MPQVQTPIFQFGTSRFLQAHVDLMISEALQAGKAAGPITVVQTTGSAERAGRLAALAEPGGFPVKIRGLKDGVAVDTVMQVTSVVRTFSTATEWEALCQVFAREARYVLSNTGDRGFSPSPADVEQHFDQAMSYPAKLKLLLKARFESGGGAPTIFPMELIEGNGDILKSRVLELAARDDDAFKSWLDDEALWVNSLVDRIVSEPIEPAGAIAEPYALWAIQDQPGLVPPCQHDDIKVVADLGEIEALKLYILNVGHTVMAQRWLERGSHEGILVRDMMSDDASREFLTEVYQTEVLPGFGAAGMLEKAQQYMAVTFDRFANPYLEHRIADIAQNHSAKVERRIGGFLTWARTHGDTSPKPRLSAIADEHRDA